VRALFPLLLTLAAFPLAADDWPQFASDPSHHGSIPVVAQPLGRVYSDIVYDPFVPVEQASRPEGDLTVHYMTPLVDGDDVFMEFKSGAFTGLSWQTQTWSVHRLHWENGQLADKWTALSDWKPVPAATTDSWEPVFHALLANGFLYMPGASGTLLQVDRQSGAIVARIYPFPTVDASTFVTGPLSADAAGNIYYSIIRFDPSSPWSRDPLGSWLVRVTPDGKPTYVPYSLIISGAPQASDNCLGAFDPKLAPLPPSPDAVPPSIRCGPQRPGLNIAPAIGPDGTIYVVSRAHYNSYWAHLAAVNADLTPKWTASLRSRFHDGCNVLLPPNGTPGGCRDGTATGVDPNDNQPGSGRVLDNGSSSPVVGPDGTILFGAYTLYNDFQGHLMQFSSDGRFLRAYTFGWDITPAIYAHNETYSILIKENHYGGAVHPVPEYFITQLDPQLNVEWQYKNTNANSCGRGPDGLVRCVGDHPNGFEWCVNAPAVDAAGTVYANSEDGSLYAIGQGGVLRGAVFLQLAIGAAYTPVSIGADGHIYAQNAGHLFAIGAVPRRRAIGMH
jgi:outer membrane protein assembly factor BamB